jgi:phage gpG-like protein
VHNTKLIALQKGENKEIKRFQSRSLPQKQFFKLQQSDKKYFYDEIASHFNSDVLKEFI